MDTIYGTHAGGRNSWQLTKLYSDVKQSYRHAIPTPAADDGPEMSSLNRKFRMQKDRLIAWGLEWTDGNDATSDGPIGENVERAGLTEIVSSVMENIIVMIDDVERMKTRTVVNAPSSPFPMEKIFVWNANVKSQYEDLIRDITSSIDLLCELSKSRKSVHPKAKEAGFLYEDPSIAEKRTLSNLEAARASEDLVTTLDALHQPINRTAPKLSRSSLIMPEEAPPPYDSSGIPCPVRIVGRLRTEESHTDFKGNHHQALTVPVLVEYARFDGIYQNNGVPLPFNRLDQLSVILATAHANKPASLLNLLGYFEDSSRPRIGLVYELPQWAQAASPLLMQPASAMRPTSLFNLLQSASKSQPSASMPIIVPALEERFSLASQLVSAFACLERSNFTHRDVNSGSVTFFPKPTGQQNLSSSAAGLQYAIRQPALCSFDLFSEYDIDASPENLNQNIYRHPDDPRITGPASSEDHHLRFDLYSLGLILLEIGLWVPLADIFKEKYSLKDFSLRLEKIWIPRLASKCGTAYMSAVQHCVSAGTSAGSSETNLRATFDRISSKFARCCLLDDSNEIGGSGSGTAVDEISVVEKRKSSEDAEVAKSSVQRSIAVKRKPVPRALSANEKQREESEQTQHAMVPAGAHPHVPLEPEYEIPGRTKPPYETMSEIPRYTFPFLDMPKSVRREGSIIAKRLAKISERVLDIKESASIATHGFGQDESTAKPTICIMCTSTRKFYKSVRKHLEFVDSSLDIIFFKGDIVRSKATKRTGVTRRSARTLAGDIAAKNPAHHVRPLCGSSIGAWKDYEHLPPVSFGGVVLVNGEPFGMSVHHMLEAPDEEDEDEEEEVVVPESAERGVDNPINRSMATRQESISTLSEMLSNDNADALSDLSESDTESLSFSDIDEETTAADDNGDTDGVSVGDGLEITITQPALADVTDGFFPVEEDKDDDHLDSHSLGHIHASSGIRRSTHDGIEHEIDWALLRLNGERLQPHNVVAGGRRFSSATTHHRTPQLLSPICRKPFTADEDLYPTSFLPATELSNLPVHCTGRTSGLSTGRIGMFMEFVKMAGRRSWAESWTVHAGESQSTRTTSAPSLGTPGDSGAWIVDNEEGRICGHVLAWSDKKQVAYIAPMEVMLSDMKDVLGTDAITLPGGQAPVQNTTSRYACNLLSSVISHLSSNRLLNSTCRSKSGTATARCVRDAMPDLGNLNLKDDAEQARSATLLAQHMLMTGSPTHLEREWSARRSALGFQASG